LERGGGPIFFPKITPTFFQQRPKKVDKRGGGGGGDLLTQIFFGHKNRQILALKIFSVTIFGPKTGVTPPTLTPLTKKISKNKIKYFFSIFFFFHFPFFPLFFLYPPMIM
jgi:hypothetical protein